MDKPSKAAYAATESPIHLLHRASQCADDLFARVSTGLSLTARQFVVLAVVAQENDPSQTLICEKSGIDRSTLADIVARLVARGLLTRRRTRSDGRKYAVRLTDEGLDCLARAIPTAREVDSLLTRSLSADQKMGLDATLNTLVGDAETGARKTE